MATWKAWKWAWCILVVGCAEPALHPGEAPAARSLDAVPVFHAPPGSDGTKLLFVDPEDVADHLAHGDHLGSVVDTTAGPVVGIVDRPEEGDLRVFEGIPYASPPVGNLRWRPPVPPAPWQDPLDVSRPGPVCPQDDHILQSDPELTIDEDCLSLAVWAPAQIEAPRPVMVWIHGGSFVHGSGTKALYDPRPLVEENGVVVVNINYRLGALGFLTDPLLVDEQGSAGNYGLMDQQLALEWVRDNVAAFGGDPENVTLFGESAGANSVCRQLVATPPPGPPLFHRAILESGPCGQDGQSNPGSARIRDLLVDCAGDECACAPPEEGTREQKDAAVLDCLRALPASTLVAAEGASGRDDQDFLWGPTVDGRFLPAQSMALFAHGAVHPDGLSLIVGANDDEGTMFIPADRDPHDGCDVFTDEPKCADDSDPDCWSDYDAFVQNRFALWDFYWGPIVGAILRQWVPEHYDPADRPDPSGYWAASDLEGDWRMTCFTHSEARWASGDVDTWVYLFDYDGMKRPELGCTDVSPLGAAHASELALVFDSDVKGPLTADEQLLGARIRGYWTRFAATGDPNPDPAAPEWPKYDLATDTHLVLDVGEGGVHPDHTMHDGGCPCVWELGADLLLRPGEPLLWTPRMYQCPLPAL